MAVATAPLAPDIWPRGSDVPARWLRLGPHVAWLDSGVGDADRGRRSLVALELAPAATVDRRGARVFDRAGAPREVAPTEIWGAADTLFAADAEHARDTRNGVPLGWICVVAYEARHLADTAHAPRHGGRRTAGDAHDGAASPLLRFDRVVVGAVSDERGARVVAVGETTQQALAVAETWARRLHEAAATPPANGALPRVAARAPDRLWYTDAVGRVRDAIGRGDVYQACVTFPVWLDPPDVPIDACYALLRRASPGDYGAYLRLPGVEAASTSPERLLRIDGRRVVARPMKGTRARQPDAAADARAAAELQASEKDRAENVMIVDLLRNDLGSVCVPGSVHVPALFEVESYATVHQLTSTVEGTLRAGTGPFSALRAVFPPGSMTGAPKIAACHLIDALELSTRGLYAGTIGWVAFDGLAEFSVVIRTLQRHGEQLRWDAGGGIVWDSDPDDEWLEALAKCAPLRALGVDLG